MLQSVEAWVPTTYQAFRDYRLGAASFSAPMLAVLRRMLAGETVDQAGSGLSKREWAEMQAVLGSRATARDLIKNSTASRAGCLSSRAGILGSHSSVIQVTAPGEHLGEC